MQIETGSVYLEDLLRLVTFDHLNSLIGVKEIIRRKRMSEVSIGSLKNGRWL